MELSNRTDKELVKELKSGNPEVFDELIARHANRLYQTAYGLLSNREDAEEVVQDAFVRAYRAIDKFRGDSSFQTWIQRIVINLARNKYQWNRRRGAEVNISISNKPEHLEDEKEADDMHISDDSMQPDNLIEGVEFEGRLMDGFEKLPDTLKETMILRHVNELSYEKISETLNCKVGTVKSRIARGRELLREFFFNKNNEINLTS
jgi:RNA polymerase sigma-70 factor (ECF subfamily)